MCDPGTPPGPTGAMQIRPNLDEAIIALYAVFNTPADRFSGDQCRAGAFTAAVRERVGNASLTEQEVIQRLLYLRKRCRLPRLRRQYHGRNRGA